MGPTKSLIRPCVVEIVQFYQPIMCSACIVYTRFVLNNFSGTGLGGGPRTPPWLRPWIQIEIVPVTQSTGRLSHAKFGLDRESAHMLPVLQRLGN